MKNNKLKQKWESLPYSARDVTLRAAAASAVLVFLMVMSDVARYNKQKAETVKTDKATELIQENPQKYQQLQQMYLQNKQQKQK